MSGRKSENVTLAELSECRIDDERKRKIVNILMVSQWLNVCTPVDATAHPILYSFHCASFCVYCVGCMYDVATGVEALYKTTSWFLTLAVTFV